MKKEKTITELSGIELTKGIAKKNYSEIINNKKQSLIDNKTEHYFIEYSFCCGVSDLCENLLNIHILEVIKLDCIEVVTLSCDIKETLSQLRILSKDVDSEFLSKIKVLKRTVASDKKPKILPYNSINE